MYFANRCVLRFALNFVSDGEVVREVGREFQKKRPEKANAELRIKTNEVTRRRRVGSSRKGISVLFYVVESGNGYINDYPCGRLLRDAKLYEIGAGTTEIRKMIIGRSLNAEYS
ncbi:hypothetical protein HELRODRAFT_164965 [Helobdella robusta]|uniref:Acyl-CoA dehydrogenase/oxidase C-terminal domain-containing protein n=1 Tax=Helobdella robusta TaxID=6412 RepID=T1EW10_HELRO|nr:hypothetical protein HELRODRAFT_164965 [Helobdella robusta]ESN92834.1 hypothetical protein HELRODRAFT_164965 [Helobdella robusta]